MAYTSVTPRSTRSFQNDWGSFVYRTLKQPLFFGCRTETLMGVPVRIATAEKALVDLWYLEAGEWTEERMESMRFEPETISAESLLRIVEILYVPRLSRAAAAWLQYAVACRAAGLDLAAVRADIESFLEHIPSRPSAEK